MMEIQFRKKLDGPGGKMNLEVGFQIEKGDFVCLYGKSGMGKTSMLRILAGLMEADNGFIKVRSEIWLDVKNNIFLQPQKRNIGFVFQDYALFPHLTILENLQYASRGADSGRRIKLLLEMMALENLMSKKPSTLSGGQKQRVAIARALIQKPEYLLLDEPLAAIDLETRIALQDYLLEAHKKYKLTTIMVSHDHAEIFKLADKVLILEGGKIKDMGIPSDVFLTSKKETQAIAQILNIESREKKFIVDLLFEGKKFKIIKEDISNYKVGDYVTLSIGESLEL